MQEPAATVSLMAAAALLCRSKRTLWRRIGDGTLRRAPDDANARTMLYIHDVAPELPWPLAPQEWELVLQADGGDRNAQAELGLRLLVRQQTHLPQAASPASSPALSPALAAAAAVYWFNLAAKQGHADAMQWLARAYLAGEGVPPDANVGTMWLAKAAAAGHPVALAQMECLTQQGNA